MGHVYVITSGKGGVGKTVTTFNIGVGLSMMGKKVVLIDADICLPNLDKIAGMENEVRVLKEIMEINGPKYNLEYILKHICLLQYIIITHSKHPNLSFIPAQVLCSSRDDFPELMEELVDCLRERFDYILIDCPSGIGQYFKSAVSAADRAIVLATLDITSIRDADTVIGKLEDMGIVENLLIINRVNTSMYESDITASVRDIVSVLSIELLGIVPEDNRAIFYSNNSLPIITRAKSEMGWAFRNIVSRIIGDERNLIYKEKTHRRNVINGLSNLLAGRSISNRNVGF